MSFDRRGMIAKLHVAKAQIGMAEDAYRALLQRVAGVDSSRVASDSQLLALVAEMRRLGFKEPRPVSEKLHVRKIWALWRGMAPLLDDGSDAALRSFCRRQTGLTDPEWLDGKQAAKVIEGLKAWGVRLAAEKQV